jgi:hypothetical protein
MRVAASEATISTSGTSIILPSGWVFINISAPPVVFQIVAPKQQGNLLFESNLTLAIEDKKPGEGIEDIRQGGIEILKQVFKDLTVSDIKKEKNGAASHIITYTNQNMRIKAKQVIHIQKGKAYILTFSALIDEYDSMDFAFRRVFELKSVFCLN